jgi:hypothetical protein
MGGSRFTHLGASHSTLQLSVRSFCVTLWWANINEVDEERNGLWGSTSAAIGAGRGRGGWPITVRQCVENGKTWTQTSLGRSCTHWMMEMKGEESKLLFFFF